MRTRTAISGFGNPCYVQFHYETLLVPRRRIERRGVPVETATASQRAGRELACLAGLEPACAAFVERSPSFGPQTLLAPRMGVDPISPA